MNTKIYKSILISASFISLVIFTSLVKALESIKLDDVIASNGIGNINLFDPFKPEHTLNASILEQFRQNNDGELVFAVDVNEAANGSEKASTQGVAIESVELIIVIEGVEFRYTEFTTRTHSILAKKGSTQRGLYSTLIGNSGSNRITSNSASGDNASSFDSTLNIPIPQDISQATEATLNIRFLDTNIKLGDPEAFYDYSNGYEDIAIITKEDADYLNQLAPGSDEAPLVLPEETIASNQGGTVYYPSQSGYYIAAYEDFFPYRGDYDFNDLAVGYRVTTNLDNTGNIIAISAEGYLIARGAGYNHDWHLRIAMPEFATGSGELSVYAPGEANPADGYPLVINTVGDIDIKAFKQTRWLWADASHDYVNTLDVQTLIQGHRFAFNITLDTPVAINDLDSAPFDPYLFVHDTGLEIHLDGKSPVLPYSNNIRDDLTLFIDDNNYPFAQIFPETWKVPIERADLGEAYPEFVNFIRSGRKQNIQWYKNSNSAHVKQITPGHWKW